MVRIRIQNHINEQTGSLYISRRKTSQYKIGQDRKIHRKELNKRCSPILVFRKISTETTTDYYLIIPKWQNFNKLVNSKEDRENDSEMANQHSCFGDQFDNV